MANNLYDKKIDRYTLLHDAYYGVGLFENGEGLRKHPREMEENFADRKALAYYLNYLNGIVNSVVDPIFKDDIKTDYNDSEMFEAFLKDCDGAGTSYQDFLKSAAQQAKLYGAAYIIVDNAAEVEETRAEALEKRNFPFLKIVTPSQITDWEINNRGRIVRFEYTEKLRTGEKSETTTRYEWTEAEWRVGDKTGAHTLGRVPVVQWLARNTPKTEIKPPSEYISVAQSNYFLYQLCSWHTQMLRDQAFNILIMPDTGATELTIGTNNIIAFPPESSHVPSYIAPQSGPSEMLTGQMDRIIKEMFRMSGMDSVVGVQTDKSKSGVAKQWDFEKTNKRLADFAVRCENADKAIVELYEAWSKENVGYSCEYPRDFKINDVADALADAQSALDLGFDSVTYKQEVLKNVLAAYLPNLEPEIYDKIIEEVAKAIEDKKMHDAYEGDILEDGKKPKPDKEGEVDETIPTGGDGNTQVGA